MKTYGKFEALKELYQTPTGSVWSARPVRTGGAATCCIKLIGGETAMFGPVDAGAARGFLAAAAAQQKIAADADAWAPIYDYGPDPAAEAAGGVGALFVTKLYPRSAQRLIDTKVHLSAADLRFILQGVVRGLRELRAVANRPHGNLKPGNVLLADKLRNATSVALSDPDPTAQPVASLTRLPDVKALGALLFSLVTGKPYMTARWPVPMSADWDRLGTTGPLWLQLCNNLLNTRGAADEISLEMIGARVDGIRPTRRKLARRWVAAAAIVIIGVCAYWNRARILPQLHRDQMAQWPHLAAVQLAAWDQAAFSFLDPPKHNHVASPSKAAAPASQPIAIAPSPPPSPPVVAVPKPPLIPAPAPAPRVSIAPALVQAAKPAPVAIAPPPPVAPPPDPDIAARAQWMTDVQSQPAPAGLPPAGATAFDRMRAEFLRQVGQSHDSLDSQRQRWAQTLARVRQVDLLFPAVPAPDAQQAWQLKVAEVAQKRRDQAIASAVSASSSGDADIGLIAAYRDFIDRMQRLFTAGGEADQALAAGDVPNDRAAAALQATGGDSATAQAAAPLAAELAQLAAAEHASDRPTLIGIVDDRAAIPGVRVAAWQRLMDPALAPGSLADVAAEQRAGAALADALDALGNPAGKSNVAAAVQHCADGYFAGLTDPSAVAGAVAAESATPAPVPVASCPPWFQYDLALWRIQHGSGLSAAADVSELTALAAKVDEPSAKQLATVLSAPPPPPPGPGVFERAGPGSVGWTLRSHRGPIPYDSVTYLPPVRDESQDQAIEFLRVSASAGSACYLCTSEVSVARLQQSLASDLQRVRTFRGLGPADSRDTANPGPHIWTFGPDGDSIMLDDASYNSYFQRAASTALPAQFVTPRMAMYVARLLGCRLPGAEEWRAALTGAARSQDDSRRGFAIYGWKLRDALFQQAARRNAAIEAPPLDDGVLDAGGNGIWTAAAVKKLGGLGGETLADTPDTLTFDGADELTDNASAAFRPVGSFAGVFHDLIGNVAEFVTDGADPRQVRVIGGSALSPPSVDPLQPLPLPASGKTAFADVGFRLAFSDPTVSHDQRREAIASARLLTAPVNAKPIGVANTP